MRISKQSDTYEETDSFAEVDNSSEASEVTQGSGITHLWGIPKNYVFIAAAVLVIAVICIVLFCLKRDTSPSSGADNGATKLYTESGDFLGTVDVLADGIPILGSDNTLAGTISSVAGAMSAYDKDGNFVTKYDLMLSYDNSSSNSVSNVGEDMYPDAPIYTEPEPATENVQALEPGTEFTGDNVFEVLNVDSDEDLLLKTYGYTGDEIELARRMGIPAETMIETAQKLRDESIKADYERMSDSASEEFQTMKKFSIFGSKPIKYYPIKAEDVDYVYNEGSFIVNADYDKCPTYGNQLMIHVKIANATYAFMFVSPGRWAKLPQSGNIVVEVSYHYYGPSSEKSNMYITSVREVETTSNTVSPEDNGVDINDLIHVN